MIIRDVQLETVCGITSKLPENALPEVAFAGKSNVGKSSLINCLLARRGLARTSSTPGKTQTINFYRVKANGASAAQRRQQEEASGSQGPLEDLNCYFVDLPGYGYARASEQVKAQWGKLIERYLRESKQLREVFLLVDIRHAPGNNDKMMYDWILKNGYQPVIIATKLDKIKRSQVQKQLALVRRELQVKPGSVLIPFSAETRQGREEIWELITSV